MWKYTVHNIDGGIGDSQVARIQIGVDKLLAFCKNSCGGGDFSLITLNRCIGEVMYSDNVTNKQIVYALLIAYGVNYFVVSFKINGVWMCDIKFSYTSERLTLDQIRF